ncbi:hypothetical protein EVAR_5087_1 [Eumeta japonica]|uniref:Uncharacterized protein n=1 Tax=Eumeta variegata TaxID=151549 RepID=A0A4C1SWW4_EUMVA|nr:hypothetical protein EVAR_5087_1 [Eumeta japonica]
MNESLHSTLEGLRSESIFCSKICARVAPSCVFYSYQFENIGRKLPVVRGRRHLPHAVLDHCPDVVGKSTCSRVEFVDCINVVGNAIQGGSDDFFKRG